MNASVIIVTHNRSSQIRACIDSILVGTRYPKEIIIVDDSDAGKDSARTVHETIYPKAITVIYRRINKHKGVSYSRNFGIKASSGDIVVFVDDDCRVFSDWISSIILSHTENPRADAITGYVLPAHPNNYWNQVLFRFHVDKSPRLRRTDFLFGANYSFKRRVFDRDKFFFNERMIHCSEDRYISFILKKNHRQLLYDPRIKVIHEFRTSIWQVCLQWMRYGLSDFYFWQLTPEYHENIDSDYFRKKATVSMLLFAPLRSLYRIYHMLQALGITLREAYIIPGIMIVFASYYAGVYRALCENTWPSVVQRISSDDLLS